jgi:LPS O-antigen subunit length determinant protein (WzzB/FepE family)
MALFCLHLKKAKGAMATVPTGFYLDSEYGEDSSVLLTKSPQALYQEYVNQHMGGTKKDLPKVSNHEALYTSTALLLKKTKVEVEEYGKDLGALHMVMELPVGADVRRSVARIFADPKAADEIAEEEWRRREDAYNMNREHLSEKLQAHLRREKEALNREMQQLTQSTTAAASKQT